MDIVVKQPYILVSKLKKTKIKFLRQTGYLNPIKTTIKQDLLLNLVSAATEVSKSEMHPYQKGNK